MSAQPAGMVIYQFPGEADCAYVRFHGYLWECAVGNEPARVCDCDYWGVELREYEEAVLADTEEVCLDKLCPDLVHCVNLLTTEEA